MGLLGTLGGIAGGVVSGPFGAAAGLLGGNAAEDATSQEAHPMVTGFDPTKDLSKTNALPGQNYYDDSVNSLIDQQNGRTAQSNADQLNHGINPNQGEFSSPQGLPGQQNDSMIQAINKRAEGQSAQSLRGIQTQNEHAAKLQEAEDKGSVVKEVQAKYQNEVQNFQQQYAYQMQRYQIHQQYQAAQAQAQASLYGSIFGGIGKLGGAAIAAA